MQSQIYTTEWPKADIFCTKYLYFVVWAGWFVVLTMETFGIGFNSSSSGLKFPLVSICFVLPLLVFVAFLFFLSTYKFAYKIVIDCEKNIIESHLIRRKGPVAYSLRDLQVVEFNWHIYFRYMDGTTIWYKTSDVSKLLDFLRERDIPKQWGSFGKFFLKKEYLYDKKN